MNDYTVYTPESARSAASDNAPLAMAFVRDQNWERPMSARDALNHGTAFRSLVKPFRGAEVCDEE